MKGDILPYDDLDFAKVLEAFLSRGFIRKYRCGSEWFGCLPTFAKHQYVNNREANSEIPDISEADEVIDSQSMTSTREARVLHATLPGIGREGEGEVGKGGSEPPRDSKPPSPAFLEFPVTGGERKWPLREVQVLEWERLFPGIDVRKECRKALAWVLANNNRKKTFGGMASFLVRWLSKENDGGRSRQDAPEPPPPTAGAARQKYGDMQLGAKP